MCHAFEMPITTKQELPSPDGSVGPITGAIENDANCQIVVRRDSLFRKATGKMGVVMLDANKPRACVTGERLSQPCRPR